MTDFVKISLSTDNVKWSDKPARWNINALAKIGIVIGILMTLEAFGILYTGLYQFNLIYGLRITQYILLRDTTFFRTFFNICRQGEKSLLAHSTEQNPTIHNPCRFNFRDNPFNLRTVGIKSDTNDTNHNCNDLHIILLICNK